MTIDTTTIKTTCPACKELASFFPVERLEDGCLLVCRECHSVMWHSGHITRRPEPSEAEREHIARRTGLLEEMMD